MPDRPQRQSAARLIIAITGATGAVYGVRLLQQLRDTPGVETHLIVSDSAVLTLHQETGLQRRDVEALADVVHKVRDIGAAIASGSFQSDGMIVAPCSMKTLASDLKPACNAAMSRHWPTSCTRCAISAPPSPAARSSRMG